MFDLNLLSGGAKWEWQKRAQFGCVRTTVEPFIEHSGMSALDWSAYMHLISLSGL